MLEFAFSWFPCECLFGSSAPVNTTAFALIVQRAGELEIKPPHACPPQTGISENSGFVITEMRINSVFAVSERQLP